MTDAFLFCCSQAMWEGTSPSPTGTTLTKGSPFGGAGIAQAMTERVRPQETLSVSFR